MHVVLPQLRKLMLVMYGIAARFVTVKSRWRQAVVP